MKLLFILISSLSFTAFAANQPDLNDKEITKIITTTNKGELELAKYAQEKSQNPEIKKFAQHIIQDHSANNDQAMNLAKKLKMTPENNVKSSEIKVDAEQSMAMLKELKGSDFDKVYVTNQLAIHKKLLNDLDTLLIPQAENQELKSMLTKTRSTISQHMEHAQELQKSLQ